MEETDGEGSKCGAGKEEVKDGAPAKVSGGCRRGCGELWEETRLKLLGIVESKYFNRGIMIAILINTISMGIEHHNQVWISSSSLSRSLSLSFSIHPSVCLAGWLSLSLASSFLFVVLSISLSISVCMYSCSPLFSPSLLLVYILYVNPSRFPPLSISRLHIVTFL